ncbi:hypothetical protein [Nocardia sp. bgisy118]
MSGTELQATIERKHPFSDFDLLDKEWDKGILPQRVVPHSSNR